MKHRKWHEWFFSENYNTKTYTDGPPGWADPSITRKFRCGLCGREWLEHEDHYPSGIVKRREERELKE